MKKSQDTMETAPRRDINELLVNGYFKTARGRSSSSATPPLPSAPFPPPPSLKPNDNDNDLVLPHRRVPSRDPQRRRPPPPRPTVEDEAVSLARESGSPSIVSEVPLRGVLEQYPIILEADITDEEAARLHQSAGAVRDDDIDNSERRFVLIPKPDTHSPNRKDEAVGASLPTPGPSREPLTRRRSRQDLPALQTKTPVDAPSSLHRSASNSTPRDSDGHPRRPKNPRAQSELLSPDISRHSAPMSPRHFSESLATPQERHHSRSPNASRSRHNSSENPPRPSHLTDDEYGQQRGRVPSLHAKTLSIDANHRYPARSSSRVNQGHYTSDSDGDSGTERDGRRRHRHARHHRHREIQAEEGSRQREKTSPIPSPRVSPHHLTRERDRAETFPRRSGSRSPIDRAVSPFSSGLTSPRSSGDRLNPPDTPIARPRSRQSTPIPTPTAKVYPPPPEPSPSAISSRGDHKASISRQSPQQQPAPWQPPPLQLSPSMEQPVGSYRRYSEDAGSGAIVPLPTCPRINYTRGHNDWLTLPDCPSFDICPSCFDSTIAPTALRRFFIKAPARPDKEVLCDFGSSPWYRIAWLIIRKERLHDMNIFYGIANIGVNHPQCPGNREAARQWYFLIDPKTRAPIHNFNVCASCIKSVEIILPAIRGIFVRDVNRVTGPPRVCDFRFDSQRFIKYFDILETTADRADEKDAPPDPRALLSLAKRMARLPECQREKELVNHPWNVITQLPEFTVCEECFDEIVWPELDEARAIPLMFNKALQRLPRASCQLYSPKMRGIFRTAVAVDDYKLLASKARERKALEMEYKANLEAVKRGAAQGVINPKAAASETRRIEEEWAKWA